MRETYSAGRQQARSAAREVRCALLLAGLAVLAACNKPKPEEKPGGQPAQVDAAPVITQSISLEINGFNYTDLYIDSFEVNGQGGGNLFVSSPTSGGGGGVCCVSFTPGTRLPVQLTIKWTSETLVRKGSMAQGPGASQSPPPRSSFLSRWAYRGRAHGE
jgi:hypothetical protein